jgi:hypothetical protein
MNIFLGVGDFFEYVLFSDTFRLETSVYIITPSAWRKVQMYTGNQP